MSAPAVTTRWLWGPSRDLLFGCGLWYVLLFVVLLFAGPAIRAAQPAYLASLLILLVATPHYGATLVRVYEQRSERRAYALFTVWTTLVLIGSFCMGVLDPAVGTLLFTAYLTWSPWHYTGQNYGIAVMFLRRRGVEPTVMVRRFLYASYVLSFALTFLVMHQADGSARGLGEGGVHLMRLGIPRSIARIAIPVVGTAYAVALAGSGALLLRLGSARDLLPVALLSLSQALWFSVPDLARYWDAYAGVEALDFDHRAVYFNWVVLAHAVQYLWITSYYARADAGWRGAGRYFGKTLLAGNFAWLVPALVFAPQLLGGGASELNVALLVAALVNLHHFILDGAIWKLRSARIADILIRSRASSASGKSKAVGRLRPRVIFWSASAALLAVALVEFGAREIAIPRLVAAGSYDAALVTLDRLAWVGRDSAITRLQIGHALVARGRFADAVSQYERSARLTPSADALGALTQVELHLGQYARARSSVEGALRLAPERFDLLSLAGYVHLGLGETERARQYFVDSLRLNPRWDSAREGLERTRRGP